MTKESLIRGLAEMSGLPQRDVSKVLNAQANYAATALGYGETVTIPGVVKLAPATRAARNGRNPTTGEAIQIPEKRVVKATAKVRLPA